MYENAKESLEIMNSCLNLLFMILSHGCADDDEKGEIRRKLLFYALYELRSCSFYTLMKKESSWRVLYAVSQRLRRLQDQLEILKQAWFQLVKLHEAEKVTECPLRQVVSKTHSHELSQLE